jgi:hypothetical protein
VTYLTDADLVRRPSMLDDADDLTYLLFLQQGVLSVRQALRHMSRSALRQRLDTGLWRRAHRAVMVAHNGPLTRQQELWVASLTAGKGTAALLGGRTALGVLGLVGFPCARAHVLVDHLSRTSHPPAGAVVHRTSRLPPQDVCATARPPCTAAARSVVDAASWARSDQEARTVIAMAFQQRLTGLDEMAAVLRRLPRAKRRALTWQTAVDASGGAQSLGELDALALLRDAGLPRPTHQQVRVDAAGRRRYLDLSWEEWGLHVEIDGSHHLDPHQMWLDYDRQNKLWLGGEVVLRFPAWLVRERPRLVAADIRRALETAGWRP